MILIVGYHYIYHGGILDSLEELSFNYIIIDYLRIVTRMAVGLYVLITGYYMVNSKVKIKKIFNIWTMVVFYSIAMLVASMCVRNDIGIKDVIKSIFPISSGLYWFATTYVALYILSPFINKLIQKLSKKQYFILITILFVLLVVIRTIFNSNWYIDGGNGESLIWFVFLYVLAGYIRLHYNKKINKLIYLLIAFIIPIFVTVLRGFALKYLGNEVERLLDYTNILNFIPMICLFLYFREIKIKNGLFNRIIEKVAPLTFGIYLVHENLYFKPFMWKEVLGVYRYAKSPYLIIHFVLVVILVFSACAIIECIRRKLFEFGKYTKLSKKVDVKLEEINDKFWKVMEE